MELGAQQFPGSGAKKVNARDLLNTAHEPHRLQAHNEGNVSSTKHIGMSLTSLHHRDKQSSRRDEEEASDMLNHLAVASTNTRSSIVHTHSHENAKTQEKE